MDNTPLRVMVLYQSENSEPAGIADFLAHAGIDPQLTRLDSFADRGDHENLDAFIIDVTHPPHTTHAVYSILDRGLPTLILNCDQQYWLPDTLPNGCDALYWPNEREQLLAKLRDITLQSFPISLCTPKIQCMQGLNSLSIYGVSPRFLSTVEEMCRFSHSQAPVLIQGETGTGKELCARALHYLGPRREGPFIPVNCSSLPDSLFENEVFGHSRGAYTDAKENYSGLVAQAEGGTLFLDEVDSLQPRAQASLLGYIQDRKYRPLGSSQYFIGQTSIVTATNQRLDVLVTEGEFREDLLYRINTIKIDLPALRERPEDISLLARIFLRKLSEQYGQPPKSFHPDTLKWLETQRWPGNVRQLENWIHRNFLRSNAPVIRIVDEQPHPLVNEDPCVHLPSAITDYRFNKMRDAIVWNFEQQYLHRLMIAAQGNVSQAARLADKERRCLGKLLKKHGVNRQDYDGITRNKSNPSFATHPWVD